MGWHTGLLHEEERAHQRAPDDVGRCGYSGILAGVLAVDRHIGFVLLLSAQLVTLGGKRSRTLVCGSGDDIVVSGSLATSLHDW